MWGENCLNKLCPFHFGHWQVLITLDWGVFFFSFSYAFEFCITFNMVICFGSWLCVSYFLFFFTTRQQVLCFVQPINSTCLDGCTSTLYELTRLNGLSAVFLLQSITAPMQSTENSVRCNRSSSNASEIFTWTLVTLLDMLAWSGNSQL